jgi:hypothetical protein
MKDRLKEIEGNLDEAREDGHVPGEWAWSYAQDVGYLLNLHYETWGDLERQHAAYEARKTLQESAEGHFRVASDMVASLRGELAGVRGELERAMDQKLVLDDHQVCDEQLAASEAERSRWERLALVWQQKWNDDRNEVVSAVLMRQEAALAFEVCEALADIMGHNPAHDWGGGGLNLNNEQLNAIQGPLGRYLANQTPEHEHRYPKPNGQGFSEDQCLECGKWKEN